MRKSYLANLSRFGWLCFFTLSSGLFAASPPGLIDYQGVLRGAADEPLSGSYDMIFRLFDAESGGSEILVDQHLAANVQQVAVDGGLFAVGLGGGVVGDGAGPGTYASLAAVFHDFDQVWLEVQVETETLAPRTRVLASGYALNAASAGSADLLDGRPSTFFLDTSATRQEKSGTIRFHASDPGFAAVEVIADPGSMGALRTASSGSFCKFSYGDFGAECRGNQYGGYFYDQTDNSYAYIGFGTAGVYAAGPVNGGLFTSTGATGTGVYGAANQYPGRFHNSSSGADAYLATATHGVDAHGPTAAQFFQDGLPGTYTYVGYSGYGIFSKNYNGIHSVDITDSTWGQIGNSPYKVQGNGAVSFVQNHPDDPSEVVVYHAPESSEVNVYTRGSAKLVNGFARVDLDPTFAWTANPDIGLTAHLTPHDQPVALAVEEVTSTELRVRGPKGADVTFDYWVTGLRIGFEEMPAVTPKEFESAIPARASGADIYAGKPGLRAFNALERYRAMAQEVGRPVDPGLKAAADLRGRIGIGRPLAVTDPAGAGQAIVPAGGAVPSLDAGRPQPTGVPATAVSMEAAPVNRTPTDPGSDPIWFRRGELFRVTSAVRAGEVVVLDPLVAGAVKRCEAAGDRNLVGVAVGPDTDGMVEVAVVEIREVLVDAGYAAIAPGDFLTTSATDGAAMRAATTAPGTILGKALEPMESGIGTIRVLLMPR